MSSPEPGLCIGGVARGGGGDVVHAVDPATGAALSPEYRGATLAELDEAARCALDAEDIYRGTAPETRAALLDEIAHRMELSGDVIVARAKTESGLSETRLRSELARTTGQLRLFAETLRDGGIGQARMEAPQAGSGVPDLRLRHTAIGPVAVFGASNFPLAFSTAGGDVAAALAAGCPVIVKGHSAHVGTSVLVARIIDDAVRATGLPGGVFGHLIGGRAIGMALVCHPAMRAVAFTGSRSGGLALARAAFERSVPIPVYAEMSSVNPVFVLPSAARIEIAEGFVESMSLGAGQFCTNPGLVFVPVGEQGDLIVDRAAKLIEAMSGQTMLTANIATAFTDAVSQAARVPGVRTVARGAVGSGRNAPPPHLFEVALADFSKDHRIQDEMFGAASLVVRYDDSHDLLEAAERLEGQLTATLWFSSADDAIAARLLAVLERKAGRLVANGWPTGVAVGNAMMHGGPYPATTDTRVTSVGTLSVERFLRPVAYQGFRSDFLASAFHPNDPFASTRKS